MQTHNFNNNKVQGILIWDSKYFFQIKLGISQLSLSSLQISIVKVDMQAYNYK